jgi:hypothetical protein
MSYKNSYIKDIENYFLNHITKGIMLSPKEYALIIKWKGRGVPKEVIYKGISRALKNYNKKISKSEFPRNLVFYASFIEEEIRNYTTGKENKPNKILSGTTDDFIQKILDRLAKIINSEQRRFIREHYTEVRKKVSILISSKDEDMFKMLENIESEFYESIFRSLPKAEKERIITEATYMIGKRIRFMTEQARSESVLSFRNEILTRDYELKNILSYEWYV